MRLSLIDIAVFVSYFLGIVGFGLYIAARNKGTTSEEYFLASKKLPWYAVGASLIAANISSEHFIGMVGWSFLYGMAVANWCWGNVTTFTLLLFVFLPFYMRGNVLTMPEFLERRYNSTCRYMYAVISIVGMVIAMLGGVMFAGGKALNTLFPSVSVEMGIILLGVAAGTYTVYGGLLSVAWADFVQYIVLMTGGLVVSWYGLKTAGGLAPIIEALPEKFIVFYPPEHETIPWTGFVAGIVSVGVWYSCANQFIVQRCLAARSEWDAKMGVIMAGFTQAVLPLIIVVPGIVAFYLFRDQLSDGDQAWPFLVASLLPAGLVGLVMAGLMSAIMSTLSAIVNSSATIITCDLYRPLFRPAAGDHELRLAGRISGVACLVIGFAVAMYFASGTSMAVFEIIQVVFFYVSAPIAAVFLLGILWRGATARAASIAIVLGFISIPFVRFVLFPRTALAPYDSFTHHTFVVFLICSAIIILVSQVTPKKTAAELEGLIWTPQAFGLPGGEQTSFARSSQAVFLAWLAMVACIVGLYAITMWEASGTHWFDAEDVPYHCRDSSHVRVQSKVELPGFNSWTGAAQVRFEPTADDQAISFDLPVERDGRYRIGMLVTTGPGYGKFRVLVNDAPTDINYSFTQEDVSANELQVRKATVKVFDGAGRRSLSDKNPISDASDFHVQRLDLGEHLLAEGSATVALVAEDSVDDKSAIGVDHWITTQASPAESAGGSLQPVDEPNPSGP